MAPLIQRRVFRQDLFFRLNVGRIELPSLRERPEDILELFQYFVRILNPQRGTHVQAPTPDLAERLTSYAVTAGLREGNPVRDVMLPKSRKEKRTTGVYTLTEINTMIGALSGAERAAVAIAAYAGLRRSEVAGLHWSDCNAEEKTLTIERSRWRHHVNPPKSAASRSWVPVIDRLAEVLEEYRINPGETRYNQPRGTYNSDAMFRVGLSEIGRSVIKPIINKHGGEWKGFHALRRGLASNLFELGCDDLTVMRILRHASVTVTRAHYIRVRDPKVESAMSQLNAAVQGAPKERNSKQHNSDQ